MNWMREKYYFCFKCKDNFLGCTGITHWLKCEKCNTKITLDEYKKQMAKVYKVDPVILAGFPPTIFVGHNTLECDTEVIGIVE